MDLNGIGASAGCRPASLSRSADEMAPAHQALVPVAEAGESHSHGPYSHRPAAPFLAQLIATESGEPQTRERRRAEPDAAIQAYTAMLKLAEKH